MNIKILEPTKKYRICQACNSDLTYIAKPKNKRPYESWHKYNDGWLCQQCYDNLIGNPKRIRFIPTGKQIRLEENPRKGTCTLCGKKVGDKYLNKLGKIRTILTTHMHHEKYDHEHPELYTVELCPSCHAKISSKKRSKNNKIGRRQRIAEHLSLTNYF